MTCCQLYGSQDNESKANNGHVDSHKARSQAKTARLTQLSALDY